MTLLLCTECYHAWIYHGQDGCEELVVQDDDSMAGCSCRALAPAIERANDRLDWIEQRQGPRPDDGFATSETTVGVVRALRQGEAAS